MLGNRIVVGSVADAYKVLGHELLNKGLKTSPRGFKTLELIAPQIIIEDPRQRLVNNKQRKYNIFHALNEAVMLYSPSDKVKHIAEFNKNMANYSDDGETMYGSYGKRISNYLPVIVSKLAQDKDTRQATLNIYNSEDLLVKTKDVPCTSTLQFLIRDNKLHMVVNMRSNDILFGFQFDVFMFTMLQETVANTLEIDLGYYIHQPTSLHLYEDYKLFNGFEMLDNMANNSSSIGFTNDAKMGEFLLFSDVHTGIYEDIYNFKSTTINQFKHLMHVERVRRQRKSGIFNGMESSYKIAPSWAKPFLDKWVK